jgi:hypothetical protein
MMKTDDSNYANVGVAPKLPDVLRMELAAIRDGAKNGGVISPRRREGLLVEYQRVEKKYGAKLATLRAFDPSGAAAAAAAITKLSADFVAALPAVNAA